MSANENKKEEEKINEINIDQKPIETLKDDLKKENISEIKIKNQSIQNNTNSISRSFDSDKNDNNKEKEKIFINPINNKKESKFNKKKEEIKNMLINHENNKYKNQKRKNGIIQRANKKPELEPHSKYNFNETLKKLKNKSVEKKAKDLLNNNNNKNENYIKGKNNFINKLKQIEIKIEEINQYKNIKNKEENKINIENNDNKENINDKENLNNFNFNIKMYSGNSENKYQELKKLYFSSNKFDFLSLKNKYMKQNQNMSNRENNQLKNYKNSYNKNEQHKEKYKNYNKKNQNQNMIKIVSNSDNFKSILDRFSKFEENKNNNISTKNYLYIANNALNSLSMNNNRHMNKYNFNPFKSVSLEKPSKFKNIIEDICDEIKDINNYSLKRNFSHKLTNIKANIKYSTLYGRQINFDLNNNYLINQCEPNKSKDLDFDDLLKLCSKRNLKCLVKNKKFNF